MQSVSATNCRQHMAQVGVRGPKNKLVDGFVKIEATVELKRIAAATKLPHGVPVPTAYVNLISHIKGNR